MKQKLWITGGYVDNYDFVCLIKQEFCIFPQNY